MTTTSNENDVDDDDDDIDDERDDGDDDCSADDDDHTQLRSIPICTAHVYRWSLANSVHILSSAPTQCQVQWSSIFVIHTSNSLSLSARSRST